MATLISISGIPRKEKRIITPDYSPNRIFTIVPEIFTTIDEWPKYCNWDCYNCTCTINRMPFFIPIDINETEIRRCNNPLFCSPFCAVTTLLEEGNDISFNKKMCYIRELIFRMIGKRIALIHAADSRKTIINYGGHLTKKQFQDLLVGNANNHEYYR